jgi:tetratricopeptide (TPR) repeat protein
LLGVRDAFVKGAEAASGRRPVFDRLRVRVADWGARPRRRDEPPLDLDLARRIVRSEDRAGAQDILRRHPMPSGVDGLHPDVLLAWADLHFVAGEHSAADRLYRALSERQPDFSWPFFQLGRIAARRGDLDEAAAMFLTTTQLQPSFVWGWYELASTRHRQRDAAGLERALSMLLGADVGALAEPHLRAIKELAHRVYEAGERGTALALYDFLWRRKFADPLLQTRLAEQFVSRGDCAAAVDLLEPLDEAAGAWACRLLASAYSGLGRDRDAAPLLAGLVRQWPQDAPLVRDYFTVLLRLDRAQDACEAFEACETAREIDELMLGRRSGAVPIVWARVALGPWLIQQVSPAALDLRLNIGETPGRPLGDSLVDARNWSAMRAMSENKIHNIMRQLVQYGRNYREMPAYSLLLKQASTGRPSRVNNVTLDSQKMIDAYCERCLHLIESIRRSGVLPRDALDVSIEDPLVRLSTVEESERDIKVAVGPDGELLQTGSGRHRTAIAQVLGLDRMPVEIRLIHAGWVSKLAERSGKSPQAALFEWLDASRRHGLVSQVHGSGDRKAGGAAGKAASRM